MTLTSERVSSDPRRELERQISTAVPGNCTVWLDNPFNLYLIERQAEAYLSLMRSSVYGDGFHSTVRNLMERNSESIISRLAPPVNVIDLGPGYPDKTFPLLERMRAQRLAGRYTPVDINDRFLKLAADACRPFGFPVEPCHLLFEELPMRLSRMSDSSARLVLMGVTFMNYDPRRACRLLSRLIQPGGAAVIAVELLRDDSLESVMRPYRSSQARAFNFLPLEIVGVDAGSVDYFVRFERGRIEMGFEILSPVSVGKVRLQPGRRIVTSFSCRYRMRDLQALLKCHFPRVEIYSDESESCAVARLCLNPSPGGNPCPERRRPFEIVSQNAAEFLRREKQ